MGRKIVRDARAERLCVTRIGAVKGEQPEVASPSPVSLKALSAQLNEGVDRLNEGLREVQSLIIALRLGVSAAVGLPNGKTLTYGRLDHDWCLYIADARAPDTRTPLLKASREDRLAAAGALVALVDALSETAARTTEDVKAVTATLGELHKDIVDATR